MMRRGQGTWFTERKMEGPKTRSEHKTGEAKTEAQREAIYRDVMSLRAWSSSSLMALYLSFWAYNSSGGQRSTGSSGRCQSTAGTQKQEKEWERWRRREEGGRRRQTLVRIFWKITLITEKMNIWFSLRLLSSVGFEHWRLSECLMNVHQQPDKLGCLYTADL